jgi:hypothetical protein
MPNLEIIANALFHHKDYEQSEHLYRLIAEKSRLLYGESDMRTVTLIDRLADIMFRRQEVNVDEVHQLWNHVFVVKKEVYGALSYNTIQTYMNMAKLNIHNKEFNEAVRKFNDIIQVHGLVSDFDYQDFLPRLIHLANHLYTNDLKSEAHIQYMVVLNIAEVKLIPMYDINEEAKVEFCLFASGSLL